MFVDSIVFKQKDLMFIFADGGGGWGLKTDHFFVKVLYVWPLRKYFLLISLREATCFIN